ncbi:MAG: Calx-beta domain-containing protein, partial [Pseudohongiellaceae bacterium]
MKQVGRKFPCILSAVLLSALSPLATSQTPPPAPQTSPALPTLSITTATITEGEPMEVVISISAISTERVRADIRMGVTGDTATGVQDYRPHGGGSIVINPGSSSWVYSVQTYDDSTTEHYRETFTIRLDNVGGATLDPGQTTATPNQLQVKATILDNDLPALRLHLSDRGNPAAEGTTSLAEYPGGIGFWVFIQPPALDRLFVVLTTMEQGGNSGSSNSAANTTVLIPPGSTAYLISSLVGADNNIDEPDTSYTATLHTATSATQLPGYEDNFGSYTLGTPHQLTITVTDDDEPPGVSVNNATVSEKTQAPQTTLVIPITLSLPSGFTTTIDYATSDGTATNNGTTPAGNDYTQATGSLTFAPGETSKSVTLTILDDTLGEGDETFTLHLSNPTRLTLGNSAATITITDNETTPTLNTYPAHANEGETLAFILTLSPPSARTVTLTYATSDGTATAGSDYTHSSGNLTFQPGESTITIPVPTLTDTSTEPYRETFTLHFSNWMQTNLNATASVSNGITGTVFDRNAPTATLSLSGAGANGETRSESDGPLTFIINYHPATHEPLTSKVQITWGASNVALLPRHLPAGSTTQTMPFYNVGVDNPSDGPNLIYTATLLPPDSSTAGGYRVGTPGTLTITVLDDDDPPPVSVSNASMAENNGAMALLFTVNVNPPSHFTTSVAYATSDGTALAGTDYQATTGRLTFMPGVSSGLITVVILDDGITENNETLNLTLSNPDRLTLAPGASSAIGTITNDEALPIITAAHTANRESGGTLAWTITLSRPSANYASVSYATSAGTATRGMDYPANQSGRFSFAPGRTTFTLRLPITDDDSNELFREIVWLHLSDPRDATLATPSVTGTIIDNDLPTLTLTPISNAPIYELSGLLRFYVNSTIAMQEPRRFNVDDTV